MALVSGVMLLGVRLACVSDDMIKDKDAAMSVILINPYASSSFTLQLTCGID